MGGARMDTLSQAATRGAAVKVICRKCQNERYFSASALSAWFGHGERDIGSIAFRCKCGSRHVHAYAQRGVPHTMCSRLPPRPKRHEDLDLL